MRHLLSHRVEQIESSATIAMNTRAKALAKQGYQIINLSVGEPDFDTPDFIKASAIQAIQQGFTKYTAADGIPELKQAVIRKLHRDNQLDYQPSQIIVSNGVKQCLYNLAQVLLNPGDEVIIPAPYWVSYPDIIKLAEAKPIIIPTNSTQRFKITPQQLATAITPKTKLIILNSPSNPTGIAYTKKEWQALAEVLQQHPHVWIATDDIYEYILWASEPFSNIVNACPALYTRTIVLNGISKAYAMTGWRIGYAAGPAEIIAGMEKIQSQSTSNPNSIAQKAAITALDATRDQFSYMLESFKARHDLMLKGLQKIPGISCEKADGAFYLFPDITQLLKRLGLHSDIDFCNRILEKLHIATVPGTAFGAPNHFRLSTAVNEKDLQLALEKLASL